MESSAIKSPNTRPLLPRMSSAMSGFFFWGMMLEPVEKASSSSINWNSQEHHSTSSSQKRDRCTMMREAPKAISAQKSRSETPSRLFWLIWEKPSSFAVMVLSKG